MNAPEGSSVYDKTVRRRRAVLALLVVLSLLLLTAYFGEAPNGRLHGVQRGFLTVVSPIQNGANKALKPVRDLFGWFGDTLHAKGQRDKLKQNDKLRSEAGRRPGEKTGYRELLAPLPPRPARTCSYHPVTATVVGKSPNIWYSTVTIDKGSSSGVRDNDPVDQRRRARRQGRRGRLRRRRGGPDHRQLDVASPRGSTSTNATGMVQPKVGEPNDLLLQYLPGGTRGQPRRKRRHLGDRRKPRRLALPAGILIGQVSSEGEESGFKSVNVHPLGRPAQPQHRAGAHVCAGQQAGAARRPPVGLSGSRPERHHRQAKAARYIGLDEQPADERSRHRCSRGSPCSSSSSCSSRSASSRRCPCSASRSISPRSLVAFVGPDVRLDDRGRRRLRGRPARRPRAACRRSG